MDLTKLLGEDFLQWLKLFLYSEELKQNKRGEEEAEEDAERTRAALQRPTIIPWNFPNANGRRAMIVPGMFNEETGTYAPSETIWADQYTPPTDDDDDDDDDSLLDDYVNQ